MIEERDSEQRMQIWLETLRQHGYRLTSPRRAVVEVMAEAQQVLNPTEIYDLARQRYPKLGLVTVYRTLERLEDLDLVQRVHRPGGCEAFFAGAVGHQHMLICRQCGRVEYFDGDNIDPLIRKVEGESGYDVQEHWLQLFGVCQRCQAN